MADRSLLDQMREQAAMLRLKEEITRKERGILERAVAELEELHRQPTEQNTTPQPIGHNRKVVLSILQGGKGPLRVVEMAKRAHEVGLIKSAKGYEGVYAIVQTILRRHSKTSFIQVGPGTWDLRERHGGQHNLPLNDRVAAQPNNGSQKTQLPLSSKPSARELIRRGLEEETGKQSLP